MATPRIVGIGGALREGSTSDAALAWMITSLREQDCETTTFKGADLDFPAYDPSGPQTDEHRLAPYLDAVRNCDVVVISSPVYHGGPSGLIKNAIDHLQPLMGDRRSYLAGRPVSCIAAGGGLQGAVSTLSALQCGVHALRGWPTPMQVPINSSSKPFEENGACTDLKLEKMPVAVRDDLFFARAMANR